jgi:biotin carboxylase
VTSRLLVLGAGRHQAPLIRRAEARGIRCVALDPYGESPGKKLATYSVLADAFDADAVLAAARHHRVDGVTTIGTDQTVAVMARVAADLELPAHISPEGALRATNKHHMRAALASAGIPMAEAWTLTGESPPPEIPVPCVVKAADSQGQRGMRRIDDAADLDAAIREARAHSRTATVVVERFEAGPELTINAWISGGTAAVLLPADRITYNPAPALGICLQHVVPSVHQAHASELRRIAEVVARAYGVEDGPLYIQTLATAHGWRVVEAASRVGGGHEAQLFDRLHGLSLIDLTIDRALGIVEPRPIQPETERGGVVTFVMAAPGIVHERSSFADLVDSGIVDEGAWYVDIGHEQRPIADSMGRVGYFIVTAADRRSALERADVAYSQLRLTDASGRNLVFWPERSTLNVPAS